VYTWQRIRDVALKWRAAVEQQEYIPRTERLRMEERLKRGGVVEKWSGMAPGSTTRGKLMQITCASYARILAGNQCGN